MNYQTIKGMPSHKLLSITKESTELQWDEVYEVPNLGDNFSVQAKIITAKSKWTQLIDSLGKEEVFKIIQGVIDEARSSGERVKVIESNGGYSKRQLMKVQDLGKGKYQVFTTLFVDYHEESDFSQPHVVIWVR